MSALEQIIELSKAYGSALEVENSTVSWRVFGDSKKLDAIIAGADLQVTRYERALQWFSDNWPEDAAWPTEISRLAQTAKSDDSPRQEGAAL